MVSHLPIISGEKVKLFLLFNSVAHYSKRYDDVSVLNKAGFTYADKLLKPAYLPISGEYNDYGGIEYIEEDFNYKLIEDDLKERFGSKIKIDQDEIIENWSLPDIIRGIERGGCREAPQYWNDKNSKWINFDFSYVFIREDIISFINKSVDKQTVYDWDVEGDGFTVSIGEKLKNDFQKEIEISKKLNFDKNETDIEKIKENFRNSFILSDNRIFRKNPDGGNTFMSYQKYESFLMGNVENKEVLDLIFSAWSDFKKLEHFINHSRLSWNIQAGAGSQNSDWEYNKMLAEEIVKICDAKILEYSEEWNDDEDEDDID